MTGTMGAGVPHPARTLVTAAMFCLVLALYGWIDASSRIELSHFPTEDFYPGLARSFLEGHTYLDARPDPRLLKLADPYNPEKNKDYRLLNVSLYHGKYYVYFGPAPAVTLFVPYRLLFGHDLSQAAAVFLFSGLTFVVGGLLFLRMVEDFFPEVTLYWRMALLLTLGLGNVLPFLLRRPDVYEVAISGAAFGIFVTFASVYAAARDRPRAAWWLGLAGTGLALAIGSRFDYAPVTGAFLVLVLYFCHGRSRRGKPGSWWPLIGIVPPVVGLAALAIYNHARFGSYFELGNTYQLGEIDETKIRFTGFDNIPYNIWFYIFSQPEFLARFPFARPDFNVIFALPLRFYGLEYMAGLIYFSPIALLALAYPALCAKFYRRRDPSLFVALNFITLASLLTFGAILCYSGATMRYFVDFLPGFLLLGCLTLCHYLREARAVSARRHDVTRLFVHVLVVATCFYGLCFSVNGYHNLLLKNNPETYHALEQFFNFCAFEKVSG